MIRRLAIVALLTAAILPQPISARDLGVRDLPKLGEPAAKVQARLADARVPQNGGVNEMYFVTLAGHRTLFRPHYYVDQRGVARLAAVDIGYRSEELPYPAYHAFMAFYVPDDMHRVSPGRYTERERVETDAIAGESDTVVQSASHAAAIGAKTPCSSGVRTTGLVMAIQRDTDTGHVISARVESEYGTACWHLQ